MNNKLSIPLGEFKERELEILTMMADGLSNQEIADHFFITKETVRWYNKQIYSKLGTSRRTEAIALARDMGLLADEVVASHAPQVSQHNLPVTTGPFIGRAKDLKAVLDLLDKQDIRLVSIVGAGGMGKSRLSLEIAHRIKPQYEHGAIFIDLTPVRNPDDIAKFAVSSLGISIGNQQNPQDVLFNYCRQKELLLIFDNFEHVLSGVKLLSDILENAPKVKIIASSRERLNLRIETAFYLQPVTKDADRLFIEVATTMRPNLEITEDDLADVQHIVELVGGLPLGLILAATWVDLLPIAEIAEEIKASLDFLRADMGDMPERQHSIHAVIDPSWKRLSEEEQTAFMWSSVFRGGFTRDTFQQLTGTSIRTLQNLVNRSLIVADHGRRYDMHPLLRQYAREKLISQDMLDDAKRIHLRVLLNFARQQNKRMYDGHYLGTLGVLDAEQDNFRAALYWAFQGNSIEEGVLLAIELSEFWETRSQGIEAIHYLGAALQNNLAPSLQAKVLCRLGRFHSRHNPEQAPGTMERALSIAEEALDQESIAWNLLNSEYLVTPSESFEMTKKALEIGLAVNDSAITARSHTLTGRSYIHLNQIPFAKQHLAQALEIYEARGDQRGISVVLNYLATCYDKDGQPDAALHALNRSMQLKRQIGDRSGVASRLAIVAYREIANNRLGRASELLAESHILLTEINDLWKLTHTLQMQSYLHLVKNEPQLALSCLQQGIRILETQDSSFETQVRLAEYNSIYLWAYLLQAQLDSVIHHLSQCLTWMSHLEKPIPSLTAMVLVGYAHYLFDNGEYESSSYIAKVVYNRHLEYADNLLLFDYYLMPLIHKIEENIGSDKWKSDLQVTTNVSLSQILDEVSKELQ